ncbi:bifunctional glutamate/proline-tRNA ligase [Cryptococcus amylolentus CBS 6039]|uniref:proline--tRNA ligase n=1 Tax=Cryptococcus amylolentus CBS 6039 TaxID=1295533 RepID=A0A1E3HF98_9TREE|nr:bifunctional glutamate/proline-tRNA ligase [Cryptococcus amylolentus CBS 6039]ODN75029.1 bifunctional glutamate/proline-tRNA ligase [Cryptococcus amylolentus CBS 6039]
MATDASILQRLADLKIAHPEVISHAPVKNASEWRAQLVIHDPSLANTLLTKTLLFKPKTAKSAVPTPVLVLASEATETPSGALGKVLDLKELRLASEDLIKEVLPSAASKDDVSALAVPAPKAETLHLLLDAALAQSEDAFALHLTTSATTVLIKGSEIKKYLDNVAGGEGVKVVDFAELKAAAPAPVEKKAPAPKEPKAVVPSGPADDKYEMAIQYKKDEDFSAGTPTSSSRTIQNWFDDEIKKLGVQDCYFPMFVSNARLEKEKDHIEGFAPEVAWVTRAGKSDLEEPIAIRPTSETVMYPYYAKWINSHRDLPLKLNQWNSVVRWEFKNPQPFLRTREFLWQEGHTAFLQKAEADREVLDILNLYQKVYEDILAVPGFIPTTGRGIQGGTSHHLGQNFSKMFDITVENPDRSAGAPERLFAYQNSWGLSTRTIGVMVMVHGDDQGLVLPPRAFPFDSSSVPVISPPRPPSLSDDTTTTRPPSPLADIANTVTSYLSDIQASMLARASKTFEERLKVVSKWEEVVPTLDAKNVLVLPWCEGSECEDEIKERSKSQATAGAAEDSKAPSAGAKSLCIPFDQERFGAFPDGEKQKCVQCGEKAKSWTLFGRSY